MKRKILLFSIFFVGVSEICSAFPLLPPAPDTSVLITWVKYMDDTYSFVDRRMILRDSKGWIYAVYSAPEIILTDYRIHIYLVLSTDNGNTWNYRRKINETYYGDLPAIGLGKGDTIHIAWRKPYYSEGGDTLGSDVYYRWFYDGNFGPIENVSNQHGMSNIHHIFSFCTDQHGYPHVLWDWANRLIFYSVRDFLGWNSPEVVGGGCCGLSIIVDRNDIVHTAVNSILYRKRINGVWTQPETLLYDFSPVIFLDNFDRPVLFSCHEDTAWDPSDIFIRTRGRAGWSIPLNASQTPGKWSLDGQASIDSFGNLYCVWGEQIVYSPPIYRIWYRTYNGAQWSPVLELTRDTTPARLAIPHIGYPVTNNGVDILYGRCWGPRVEDSLAILYRRLPPLPPSGMEKESEKLKVESDKLNLEVFPNPATSVANLRFQISDSRLKSFNLQSSNLSIFQSSISIKIYDVQGRLVRQIPISNEILPPTFRRGQNDRLNVVWDLRDDAGKKVSAGVYFVRLETASPSSRNDKVGEKTQTRRVVVLK